MRPNEDPVYRAHLQCRLHDCQVPAHLHHGLLNYLLHRLHPGHFLTAVLENNLVEAVRRADTDSRDGLVPLVFFLENYAVHSAWGSPKRVAEWLMDPAPVPVIFE